MSVIPLTLTISLCLVFTFVLFFIREHGRRHLHSAESESLLPLVDETPRVVFPPAPAVSAAAHVHGTMLYPFLMIEWYPNVLVVSHLVPTGLESCTNVVEFYYPEDIALFEREYITAQQAAYAETAIEDQEICQRMHDGRKALFAQGLDQHGPYQHPMETGLAHFNNWYRKQMEKYLPNQYLNLQNS